MNSQMVSKRGSIELILLCVLKHLNWYTENRNMSISLVNTNFLPFLFVHLRHLADL